jgi:hypothetical protein
MVLACLPINGLRIWDLFDAFPVDVERTRSNNSRVAAGHLVVHTRRIHDKKKLYWLVTCVPECHSSSHCTRAETATIRSAAPARNMLLSRMPEASAA